MVLAEADFRTAHAESDSALALDETGGEFDLVYRAYAPEIKLLVQRHVRDRTQTEDILQETFLRAYRTWSTVDKDRPLGPWLRTIAMRLCIDAWRANGSHQTVSMDLSPESGQVEPLVSSEGNPPEAFFQNLRREGVKYALDALTARHRRILLLKDAHGLRYEEIAKIEGTTLAALRCSLSVARRRFRERYLAVAHERGLNSLVWPIFLPLLRCLRAMKRRGLRLAEAAQHQVNLVLGAENLVSSPGVQISGTILAAALAFGSLPFTSHVPPPRGASHAQSSYAVGSDSIDATSHTAVMYTRTAGSGATAESDRGAPSDHTSVTTTQADPATDGRTPQTQTVEPSTPSIDAPSASTDPPAAVTVPVSQPDPPVDPVTVTEPNRNVKQPEDVQFSSFASSPDGQTVFAAGRNKECALQVNCPAVLFVSKDAGRTWTLLPANGFDGNNILLPPAYGTTDNRIFATSPAGVLVVSGDGGRSFLPAATGAPQFQGSADISPGFDSGDPRILVGTQPSLVQYADDTKAMSPAPYSALPGNLEPAFATRDLLMVGGRMLMADSTWTSAVFRCGGPVCTGVRISDNPSTPKLRLAPNFQTKGAMYAFTPKELFRSTDGGASFSKVGVPWADADLVDLALAEGGVKLFAATRKPNGNPGSGLYLSTDAGSSWAPVASSLFDAGSTVIRVAGSRVYAGLVGGGVACSSDLGATWASRC